MDSRLHLGELPPVLLQGALLSSQGLPGSIERLLGSSDPLLSLINLAFLAALALEQVGERARG
eukprot:6065386-Pyramimonas_sp.AAC.1